MLVKYNIRVENEDSEKKRRRRSKTEVKQHRTTHRRRIKSSYSALLQWRSTNHYSAMTELVVTRVRVVVNGPSAFARTTTRPFFGTTTVNIFEL